MTIHGQRNRDGNITLSFTLNPDSFKNNGQMKKAFRTTDTLPADYGNIQNGSAITGGQEQDRVKNKGMDKNNNVRGTNVQGSNADEGNKNTGKGNNVSNGNSNGKKNT